MEVISDPVFVTGLRADPLHVADLVDSVRRDNCGAVVSFEGRVRSPNKGLSVIELDYEAWEERATGQLRTLADDAVRRFALGGVVAVHRTGRVQVGEVAVVVAVAAAHRDAAFTAASWLIDAIKSDVAIWKKEVTADGSAWVGLDPQAGVATGAELP